MERLADLHIHTIFSDGTFTPEEVMAYAKKIGLSCIAIADHDCVDGVEIAIGLQETYDVELIPAVEITAQENNKELHVLGYFINWRNEKLKEILKQMCQNRKERIYEMADKLKEYGIDADAEEIIKYAGGKVISRLHVAKYLVEKGFIPSLKIAFDRYIGDGKPCYVNRFRFSLKEIINIIKDTGGISVIAHPGLGNVSEILPALVENGIEGIEVYHSDYTGSVSKKLEKFAQEHNLLITGGSDCHGANKKQVLMGKIKLPYRYVQRLKEYANYRKR